MPSIGQGSFNYKEMFGLVRSDITLQVHSFDITPGHTILATGQSVFFVELPLLCRALDKRAANTNLKCLVWLGRFLFIFFI